MKKRVVGLIAVLVMLVAAGCAKNTPTSPIVPLDQGGVASEQGIWWATGSVAYVVRNASTNLWEFRVVNLSMINSNQLLFTLPAANTGEISSLDYSPSGFVFIQVGSNPIYQSVWTVAKDGSNLQERNIRKTAFYKQFTRWNADGSQLAVDSNYGGQGTTLNFYNSTLTDPAALSISGSSAIWTASNKLVYYEYGTILRGTGKLPDEIIISDANGTNGTPLLQETGWPRDCSAGNQMIYVFGPDGIHGGWTTYGIKAVTIGSGTAPVVIRDGISINARIPNVRFLKDYRYIIYETADGIYQMKSNGSLSKKLASGKLPVVVK